MTDVTNLGMLGRQIPTSWFQRSTRLNGTFQFHYQLQTLGIETGDPKEVLLRIQEAMHTIESLNRVEARPTSDA